MGTLKKKYIDRDTEAEKSNDIVVLNKLRDEIENKIDGEEDKAQKTFDKDMSDSKALVATAQEGYNVAKKEEDTQKLILDDKKSKDDAAEAAQDAAQASVNLNFPLLEQESRNSIQAANQEFLNRKTEADAIKASDTEYLESEISTVDEVQKLLSQLNARGGGSSSF